MARLQITVANTVGLKIEIHQNLRNPVSILIKFHSLQQNPLI